jgi:hypothetical protein
MGKRWNKFCVLAVCGEKALAIYTVLKHIWEFKNLVTGKHLSAENVSNVDDTYLYRWYLSWNTNVLSQESAPSAMKD